jgi:hypothetical protein
MLFDRSMRRREFLMAVDGLAAGGARGLTVPTALLTRANEVIK